MPRKAKLVTLAGPEGARVRRGHEDATPERLRRARAGGEAPVDRAGVRRIGDGFDALRSRNVLDRLDVVVNETLWLAGERLRRHWHGAGYDGVSSIDLSRPSVDGRGSGGLAPSEAAQRHRDALRRAEAAVGPRLMPYLRGSVVEGLPLSALKALVADAGHARTAEALALERLREGLHRLCDHWRMRPNERPLPLAAWRADPAPSDAEGL